MCYPTKKKSPSAKKVIFIITTLLPPPHRNCRQMNIVNSPPPSKPHVGEKAKENYFRGTRLLSCFLLLLVKRNHFWPLMGEWVTRELLLSILFSEQLFLSFSQTKQLRRTFPNCFSQLLGKMSYFTLLQTTHPWGMRNFGKNLRFYGGKIRLFY